MRLRDCFKHIYHSPVWRDLPSFFSGIRSDWHESNWRATNPNPNPNPNSNSNSNPNSSLTLTPIRQETFRRATQTMDVTGEA